MGWARRSGFREGKRLSSSISEAGWTVDEETVVVGGLPITVVDRVGAAEAMCRAAVARRGLGGSPRFVTSANGQVLALCDRDPEVRDLFLRADVIHADGMPMVFASRLFGHRPLPERVATTDLVHDVMAIAPRHGIRSFLLGGRPEVNAAAIAALRGLYPDGPEIGGHHGYFDDGEEGDVVAAIDRFAPDILWVGLGVPKEQRFALRHLERLRHVGVIKTCGGLFDFLAGERRRAPVFLQRIGMEWAWRAILEPRRLGRRYLETNLTALRLLLTQTS
ncbi:MAG: WecB/TagA/CpsF family glycosyltransferase [Phyllobacteriaceae bacterium]|nr:WecB/TagA/CpsF family glycosyltransferase [Phyllobacteriaceae bacterium]